jgi:thymidylate kinase
MPSENSALRIGQGRDRYERIDAETRARIRRAYIQHSGKRDICARFFLLDALLPPEEVHKLVYSAYQSRKSSLAAV